MEFWRNENNNEFDSNHKGLAQLDTYLQKLPTDREINIPTALNILFEQLPILMKDKDILQHLQVQEVSSKANELHASIVVSGLEKRILNTIVGGGFSIKIEANGFINAELSVYFHRLVCINGHIRKIQAAGILKAYSINEWKSELEEKFPLILKGISPGVEALNKSTQVYIDRFRFPIPVILDHFRLREPDQAQILEAFRAEPGDTLWHIVNAVSQAANLIILAPRFPNEELIRRRHHLQCQAMDLCETGLEYFTSNKSVFTATGVL